MERTRMLFLSHSAVDREPAQEMRRRLLERGYDAGQLFLDSDADSGIPAGEKWADALYAGLRDCRALIALCSPSWQNSKWCFAEMVCAKAMGKDVFPVVLESCELGAVAGEHQAVFLQRDGEAGYELLWSALEKRHLGPLDVWRRNPEEHALSPEVVTAFRSAMAMADEWQSGFIGVPHLLAGLAEIPDGLLHSFLLRHSVVQHAWQETLRKTIRQLPRNGGPELTEGMLQVFRSAQQSVIAVVPELTERVLLRAIFEVRREYVDQLARKAGIPLHDLRQEVTVKVTPEADW